ncbi:MAG: AI-2E family transporter [Chloroflexota bacterium]|nr:AI-2E family transporter [Chloroflexota bacterium]
MLGVLVLYRFRQLLPSLIIAIMLAYVLNPAVGFIVALTRLPRTAAVALLYLILIILLALVPALLAPGLIQQLRAVDLNLQRVAERLDHFLNQPLNLWGYHLEFETAWQQVRRALQDILSPMASRTVSILLSAVTGLLRIVFILVTSFYILKDQPKIVRYVHHLVPTRYQADARLLGAEINSIWSTFFRGQLILCLVVGFVVGVAMAAVGLPNAAALGALAGALEILPNIGPVMAAVPAVLIALFQGSTYLPLPTFWFVVLVVGLYTLIQQVENNYLVPQIIGRSLDLHPLVVMVAVVAGANFAGVLGALLAAPTLASSRALAGYAYRKLLDQPPFPVYADQAEADEEETDQNREAPPDIH